MKPTKARSVRVSSLFLLAGITVALVAGLLPFPAFAESDNALKCAEGGLNSVFCGLANEFRSTPKLLSIFSWIGAVILGFTGLLNLKEYGDDPSKVAIRSIVIKFVLCIMLITLPFVMTIFINSMSGQKASTSSMNKFTMPQAYKGSLSK